MMIKPILSAMCFMSAIAIGIATYKALRGAKPYNVGNKLDMEV